MGTDDRLADTLAALERGERPPCPFCSAEYGRETDTFVEWGCGTWIDRPQNQETGHVYRTRDDDCYERELSALREENAALQASADAIAERLWELRHQLDDVRPDGKTVLDFFNVWLDQERATNAKLREENARLCGLLREWLQTPFFEREEDWRAWVEEFRPRVAEALDAKEDA